MQPEIRERPLVLRWRSAVLNSTLTATQKLCLLVLAEWADADGTNCWPAMQTIAEKASVNERTVRRSMEELATLGWFTRGHRRTQKGWKQFEYTLQLPDAADTAPGRTWDAPDTVSGSESPSTGHSEHLHRTLTTDAPDTVSDDLGSYLGQDLGETSASQKVSKISKARNRKLTFQAWMETLSPDQDAVPETHNVFRYADRVGIPERFLDLAWAVFSAKHEGNSKRQADWPGTFRNYVEAGWLSLWWIDEAGQYHLTTAGKQADRQHGTGIASSHGGQPGRMPDLVA